MPMSARRSSNMIFLQGFHEFYCLQRLKMSELQFKKFPTPSTFSCWKIKFQTQVSDAISPGGYVVDRRSKEVEMVDKKASRSIHGEDFPNFEMLDARIASA